MHLLAHVYFLTRTVAPCSSPWQVELQEGDPYCDEGKDTVRWECTFQTHPGSVLPDNYTLPHIGDDTREIERCLDRILCTCLHKPGMFALRDNANLKEIRENSMAKTRIRLVHLGGDDIALGPFFEVKNLGPNFSRKPFAHNLRRKKPEANLLVPLVESR